MSERAQIVLACTIAVLALIAVGIGCWRESYKLNHTWTDYDDLDYRIACAKYRTTQLGEQHREQSRSEREEAQFNHIRRLLWGEPE